MRRQSTQLKIYWAAIVGLCLFLMAFVQPAYTSGATGSADVVGTGTAGVSGITVSGVTYELDSTDARLLGSVRFEIDHAAAHVIAVIGTAQMRCSLSGRQAVCDAAGTTIAIESITSLSVVATS